MEGFKRVGSHMIRMRVTGANNVGRKNAIHPERALYRAREIEVVDIHNVKTGRRLDAPLGVFVPGKVLVSPYDPYMESEFGPGLQFYITPERADADFPPQDGRYATFHSNGARLVEGYKANGNYYGKYASYFSNDQLALKGHYEDGFRVGPWQGWYVKHSPEADPQPQYAGRYRNGQRHGLWVEWERGNLTPVAKQYFYGNLFSGLHKR